MRSGLATFTQGQFYSKCYRYLSLIWFCKLKIYDYSHISQGSTIWYNFCINAMLHNDTVLAYGDMNIRHYVNKTIVKKLKIPATHAPSVFPKIYLITHHVIPIVMCMDIWQNFCTFIPTVAEKYLFHLYKCPANVPHGTCKFLVICNDILWNILNLCPRESICNSAQDLRIMHSYWRLLHLITIPNFWIL